MSQLKFLAGTFLFSTPPNEAASRIIIPKELLGLRVSSEEPLSPG